MHASQISVTHKFILMKFKLAQRIDNVSRG